MNERATIMISTYQRLKRLRDAGEIEGGFTLIELLIVIVVLGILAAVVIFALGGITGKSAIAACQADGATASTALAAYNAQNAGATATYAVTSSSGTLNDIVTSNLIGANNGLQSWPQNDPHYAFALISGALYIEVGGPASGAGYWNITAAPSSPSITAGEPYTGPGLCTTVK
jgi:prepilin-type N-terminal cleavage/methylation domain-containing protein